jgi:hypothetical protein
MSDIAERLAAAQDEVQAHVVDRLEREPSFARELLDDPTTAMAPIIAAALGEDTPTIAVTLDPGTARQLIDALESSEADGAEVAGFDGTAPVPYPDVGGGSGGSGTTVSVPSGSTGNVGEAVTKGIAGMGMGKSSFVAPSIKVKAEGKGVSIGGSPAANHR